MDVQEQFISIPTACSLLEVTKVVNLENQMSVFGSLRRSRSKKELEESEGPENHQESEGSMFKDLLRRASSLSVKDEMPVVQVILSRESARHFLTRQKGTASAWTHPVRHN